MCYAVTVTLGDGTEVPVTPHPEKFEVVEREGALGVSLAWGVEDLKGDPRAFLAVSEAWPGRETLTLSGPAGGEPVFSGTVSALSREGGLLGLGAVSGGGEPQPGPLEVTVSADTSDPDLLTVSVLADNKGQGEVTVDFGDGTPAVTGPGDGITPTVHAYAEAGTYSLVVADADQPERTVSQDVTVPFPEQ